MPYWLEAKYWSGKDNKMVETFTGPYADQMQAETIALQKVVPIPNSEYKIHYSQHNTRDEARRECVHSNMMQPGNTMADAVKRYRRRLPSDMGDMGMGQEGAYGEL